jgi:hypothetical protein
MGEISAWTETITTSKVEDLPFEVVMVSVHSFFFLLLYLTTEKAI